MDNPIARAMFAFAGVKALAGVSPGVLPGKMTPWAAATAATIGSAGGITLPDGAPISLNNEGDSMQDLAKMTLAELEEFFAAMTPLDVEGMYLQLKREGRLDEIVRDGTGRKTGKRVLPLALAVQLGKAEHLHSAHAMLTEYLAEQRADRADDKPLSSSLFPPMTHVSAADIAQRVGADKALAEKIRKRLERHRNSGGDGWSEIEDAEARHPRYLHRWGAVAHLFRDLPVRPASPTEK